MKSASIATGPLPVRCRIRIRVLLLILIASSLMMATTLHAREISGPVTIDCTGIVHASVDAAMSQADADKGLSHRHGACHGPVLQVPTSGMVAAIVRTMVAPHDPGPDGSIPSRPVDPALRPPAA